MPEVAAGEGFGVKSSAPTAEVNRVESSSTGVCGVLSVWSARIFGEEVYYHHHLLRLWSDETYPQRLSLEAEYFTDG